MAPLVRRTWAPRGQTPVLRERRRHHRRVSTIGAVTISPLRRKLNWYLQFHADRSIRQAEVIAFLGYLRRHLGGPLQVIWDRLTAHRSAAVRHFVQEHPDLRTALLPAYAPELNPIEYGWAYLKTNPLGNFCPHDVPELQQRASVAAAVVRSQPSLLCSFVKQTGLPLRLHSSRG
jgi:transposase